MPGASSKPVELLSWMEPASEALFFRKNDPDDPRFGEVVERWSGGPITFRARQPVLLGFPCDEGVRRNGGRVGAAQAPDAIRMQFYRMTPWHGPAQFDLGKLNVVDLGNLRMDVDLEAAQQRLGRIIGELLRAKAVPILLGGGHETTYGHYLGYVEAKIECAILNIDAHLDVREYPGGGHSGSPFRQAMDHPTQPLKVENYTVLGVQPQSVARAHEEYLRQHGGRIIWLDCTQSYGHVNSCFGSEIARRSTENKPLLISVDADAFCEADVPGVSAPNPAGIKGAVWPVLAYKAGTAHCVMSLDMVEVNPLFDRDHQTARWAALAVRSFLLGLAQRS